MRRAPLWVEGVGHRLGKFSLFVERFTVRRGERVAATGPSGCGKSTLLGLLGLALRPDGGAVLAVAGVDAMALWRAGDADGLAGVRARHVGFVPQTGALLPFLTLRQNIALPQQIGRCVDAGRVGGLAERLEIGDVLDRRPGAVSVGQRQRAAIARALSHRPGVVLADEPTASVHPAQADAVLALLSAAADEDGAALVISTHDAARAAAAGFALAPCVMAAAVQTGGVGVGGGELGASHFRWPP